MPETDFVTALAAFLEALDEWGYDNNHSRAYEILKFQRMGYDLTEYMEESPERSPAELN